MVRLQTAATGAFALATLSIFLSNTCSAQVVLQTDATYQPLMYSGENGYTGCGIRAVLMTSLPPAGVEGADLSINIRVDPQPLAIFKAGVLTGKTLDPRTIKARPIYSVSIARQLDGRPVKLSEFREADDRNYLLARANLADALDLVMAMMKGEKVLLSVVTKKGDKARVLAFGGQLEKEDAASFDACLGSVLAKLK